MSHLTDIEDALAAVEFGEINLTLKRHAGKTTKLQINKYDHKRFKDNVEAVSHLLQTTKALTDAQITGSISFTLMLKNGKIEEVINQGYDSKDYK